MATDETTEIRLKSRVRSDDLSAGERIATCVQAEILAKCAQNKTQYNTTIVRRKHGHNFVASLSSRDSRNREDRI